MRSSVDTHMSKYLNNNEGGSTASQFSWRIVSMYRKQIKGVVVPNNHAFFHVPVVQIDKIIKEKKIQTTRTP